MLALSGNKFGHCVVSRTGIVGFDVLAFQKRQGLPEAAAFRHVRVSLGQR